MGVWLWMKTPEGFLLNWGPSYNTYVHIQLNPHVYTYYEMLHFRFCRFEKEAPSAPAVRKIEVAHTWYI